MTHTHIDLSGNCDCGAVTVHVSGRALSMFQCSCQNCQRVSGSGHSSAILLPAGAVRITGSIKTYSRPADSGATFTRDFCPECGTTVAAQSSRALSLRILPAGLFAGRNEWFEPTQLIFSRRHPHWDLVADHLPRYDSYRPGETA
jgi:hypothetical protein